MNDPNMYLHPSGSVECKLCLSVHANATAYLSHAQGKLHRVNVAKYSEKKDKESSPKPKNAPKEPLARVQRLPQYEVIKIRDPKQNRLGVRVEFQFDELTDQEPRYRIMSAYEQTVEETNPEYQYLVVAGNPYSTCAIKLPSYPINEESIIDHFDTSSKKYCIQLLFDETK